MVRLSLAFVAALALSSCTSRIELPGSVLAPEVARVAVEDMGPPQDWRSVDAATGQIEQVGELAQLAEDFPDSASVRLRLLGAEYGVQNAHAAADHLLWLIERDFALEHVPMTALDYLFAEQDLTDDRLVPALLDMPAPVSASDVVSTSPVEVRLTEAILRDEANQRLFATSIVSRALFVHEDGGDWRKLPLEGVGSLGGIALDSSRGSIWVASGVVEQTPDPETAFRGIIAIDRNTLEERRRVPAPEGVSISDIAVGPDGTIYGSDPVGGGVYSAATTDNAMQVFIAPGTFRSPQGIAVSRDNSALYISDYRYGLAQVMLRSRHVYRMRAAEPMLLDGVDGLWLYGNELIAIQNGLNPHRITAFELGERIGVIASHRVLERANPAWTEPLGGAISGNTLYYIGTGQWDIYGVGGVLRDGQQPRPAQVHALQLVETPPEQR